MPIPQDEDVLQDHFEEFYEDIFEELTNIGGELEQLRVCENLSDHLAGNVYAKFREEEDAEKALQKLMVPDPQYHHPRTHTYADTHSPYLHTTHIHICVARRALV